MKANTLKHSYQCRYQGHALKPLVLGILFTLASLFTADGIHAAQSLSVNSTVLKNMTFNVRHGTDLQGNASTRRYSTKYLCTK